MSKQKDGMMDQEAAQAVARRSVLFTKLSDDAASHILAAASLRHATPGTTLFHQGDAPDQLLQVVGGLVRMTQINPEGAQTTLRIMGPGELLGCVAVFQQFPFPATATALDDACVLSWRAAPFLELMNQHPAIVDNALRIVGSHARDMVQQVVEMSGKRVQQRVAGAMLRLAEQAGTEVADGIQIDFPVTRDDLAAMAGVTYFTISRTLSGWQRLGFVRNGRRRVTILAAHKLAQIANGGEP